MIESVEKTGNPMVLRKVEHIYYIIILLYITFIFLFYYLLFLLWVPPE